MTGRKTNMKDWYKKSYPDDELLWLMNPDNTFEDLFTALHDYSDVYDVIGVQDSVIRERLFAELANVYAVGYGTIYGMWKYGCW